MEPKISIDVKSTKTHSLWAMTDLREFNNRKYYGYVWVKVDLPLNHLAQPIFEAVRNGNMKNIEELVPSLEIIDAEVVGFAWRKDVEKWREFRKGETVFNPNNPKRRLFSAKTDNKACPINRLRGSKNEWEKLVQRLCGIEDD